MSDRHNAEQEPMPLDEIRRIRERLHREFDGDVYRQAEYARKLTRELQEELGLKAVPVGCTETEVKRENASAD